ncbi:MAG: IclR family transcriptional regulator C-terminal domain-containing protein, partial [Nocardioides sp.]
MSIDTSKVADSNSGSAATPSKPAKAGALANWADERLGLGFRLVPLGTAATSLVAETAVGVLTDLVAELGETANLAVLSGHQAEYVAQVPSTYSMRMFTRVGHRVALHCTGVGKAMLAHAGPALVEQVLAAPLPTPTAYTLGTADALRAALADV